MNDYERFCNEFQVIEDSDFTNTDSNIQSNRQCNRQSNYLTPNLLFKKRKIEQFISEMKTIVKAMETNECEIEKINNILSLIDVYNSNDDEEFNFGPESDDDDINPSNIFAKQLKEQINEKSNEEELNTMFKNTNQSNEGELNTMFKNTTQSNEGQHITPPKPVDETYNTFMSGLNNMSKRIFKNDSNKYLDNYIKLSTIY